MAAKPQLSTLPAELRSEIWSLALLPSPGVYRCDPSKFVYTRTAPRHRLEVEDARWLINKRRYPTVAHLCRESRLFALGVRDKEAREQSFFYCIGQDTRPFIPEIDTFWFDDDAALHDPALEERGAVGSRVRDIRNLAVSAAVVQSCRRDGAVSNWDSYLFPGIGRFENLRRVHVVFGPVPLETRCDGYETDRDCWLAAVRAQVVVPDDEQVTFTGIYDLPELRLVKATRGSGVEATGSSLDEDLAKYPPPGPRGQEDATIAGLELGQERQGVEEFAHLEKDLSQVTFHAARMVETARFRGRAIRKSYSLWDFSDDDRRPSVKRPRSGQPSVKKRTS